MVGESEANVRALFAEAEAEERQMGANRCVKMNIKYQIVQLFLIYFLDSLNYVKSLWPIMYVLSCSDNVSDQ